MKKRLGLCAILLIGKMAQGADEDPGRKYVDNFVADVITFQGRTVKELKKAFKESVDDYLEFCEERGEKPDKPFSGKFVVRISPELHHKVYVKAQESGKSLNSWVNEVLDKTV